MNRNDTRVFESGDRAFLLEVKLGIFGTRGEGEQAAKGDNSKP